MSTSSSTVAVAFVDSERREHDVDGVPRLGPQHLEPSEAEEHLVDLRAGIARRALDRVAHGGSRAARARPDPSLVATEIEEPPGDDVPLHFGRPAVDRRGAGVQELVAPHRTGDAVVHLDDAR